MNEIPSDWKTSLLKEIQSICTFTACCFQSNSKYIHVRKKNCSVENKLDCPVLALQFGAGSLIALETLTPSFCLIILVLTLFWIINKINYLCCRQIPCPITTQFYYMRACRCLSVIWKLEYSRHLPPPQQCCSYWFRWQDSSDSWAMALVQHWVRTLVKNPCWSEWHRQQSRFWLRYLF